MNRSASVHHLRRKATHECTTQPALEEFDAERFTDNVSELLCPVCTNVASETASMPCGHIFCEPCIDTWLATNLTCPVCKKLGSPTRFKYVDLQVNSKHV